MTGISSSKAGEISTGRQRGDPTHVYPRLIELVAASPVDVLAQGRLAALIQKKRPEHETIHLRSHEAKVGVPGRAHDGLAPDIEARVDEHRTSR